MTIKLRSFVVLSLTSLMINSNIIAQNDIQVSDGNSIFTSGVSSLDFDNVYVDDSVAYIFILANVGDADLTLNATNAITISGTDASEFNLGSDSSGHVLSAGDTIGFDISFEPTTAGAKTAIVSIDSDDPDEDPFTFTITGTAVSKPGDCGIPAF